MRNNLGISSVATTRNLTDTLKSLGSLIKHKEMLEELYEHDSSSTIDILGAVINDSCAWVSIICCLNI